LLDYISLLKTRLILRLLTQLKRSIIVTIGILAIDFCSYKVLYTIGLVTVVMTFLYLNGVNPAAIPFLEIFAKAIVRFDILWFAGAAYTDEWYFIFFWSGFAPSIWMWLYVLALFVTRGLLRSEKVVNWLRWALDIEKNPFRSIGAVAATLAFIVSVAIILVSVEVSRISTAS